MGALTNLLLTTTAGYIRYLTASVSDAHEIELLDTVTGLNAVIKDVRTNGTYNDINVSLVPREAGSATPATIAFNGDSRLKCLAFSGTNATPDEIPSSMEVLHDYKEGTDISFHIHWYPTNALAGNVKWQLRYAWFNRGTVVPAATTVFVTEAASGVAWQEKTSVITISGVGMTMGSRLVFSLFRDATDATDTYAYNAAVSDMGVHYQRDSFGSRTQGAK